MTDPTPTSSAEPTPAATPTPTGPLPSLENVIPKPQSMIPAGGVFTLNAGASIYVDPTTPEMTAIGQYLADKLNPSTGFGLKVMSAGSPPDGSIRLTTQAGDPALGDEGYELSITPTGIHLSAYRPAGLFRGVQTIRQLLPAAVDSSTVQAGPWQMGTGSIRDVPRFAWRGAMLDVARHFFQLEDVKAYLDLLAYYKINVLHLHLTDDQGWRLMIKAWPKLATYGGSTQVGGGEGGYYTQEQYADLVSYAQARYITIVPEIDMPGHTNAALASYPELNCDDKAPDLYTDIAVGFSSFCIGKDITYQFLDDIIRELAALTPGPYIHIGGDEAHSTEKEEYIQFIDKVLAIVQAHGKQAIGWEEIGQAKLQPGAIVQHWNIVQETSAYSLQAVEQGARVIMSPANLAYLDQRYDPSTRLGLDWAGMLPVVNSYSWDPEKLMGGVTEKDILGVEAPLWSETLLTLKDIEYMAFPRVIGIAEIGWSPASGRSWGEYQARLAAQAPRLEALGVNYYRAPEVPWVESPPAVK